MNNTIGTPFKEGARRVLLCGSGELGKEVVIELQRYGVEVIAVDAYTNAPAMQVADRAHVISMLDGDALRGVIEAEGPDLVVPEVEAIATDVLAAIEAEGRVVTPGFIDIHSHLDAQVMWDPQLASSCWHGVTTVINGNCGLTLAPCEPENLDFQSFSAFFFFSLFKIAVMKTCNNRRCKLFIGSFY